MTLKSTAKQAKLNMPADFCKALAAWPVAKAKWSTLTPIAQRDFIRWIEEAKQLETRQRRIERTCSMVSAGKRRPCCFAVVPVDLHYAIKAVPLAKAEWSGMTPDARRDVIGWVGEAKQAQARKRRIEEACALLAAGKRFKF